MRMATGPIEQKIHWMVTPEGRRPGRTRASPGMKPSLRVREKERAGRSAAAAMVTSLHMAAAPWVGRGERDVNVPRCFEHGAAEDYVSHQTVVARRASMMAYVQSSVSRHARGLLVRGGLRLAANPPSVCDSAHCNAEGA